MPIFTNPNPTTIPTSGAGSPYPSTINVSGLTGLVSGLQVTLTGLSHSYSDDIDILLVGPTGARALLMSDVGGSLSLNGATLVFDPNAASFLPDSAQITSGSYRPSNFDTSDSFNSPAPGGSYGVDFSVFNNTNPNGTWSLYVMDDASGDSGNIAGWSLSILFDPVVTVVASSATVTEDGTPNLVYTFTRTGDTSNPLTVSYILGGTATLGTDYTGIAPSPDTKTVTFLAGSATATVTLDPTPDSEIETHETVSLSLVEGPDYSVGTTTPVTGTIANDDLPVITLAVSPDIVSEDGTPNLVYSFSRSGDTSSPLIVSYTITGSADASDYGGATPGTGTITFAAGSSTATLVIDPSADSTFEADETISLTLVASANYTMGTSTPVIGTITNDDLPAITPAVSPAIVSEDGPQNLSYVFTRSGITSSALTINYTVTGSADGSDYGGATPGTGTITFAAGSSTAILSLDPVADAISDGDETVILTLAPGSGYTLGAATAATGTILDNDTAPGTVTRAPITPSIPGRSRHGFRNQNAFAALKSDGSVVTWGDVNLSLIHI